GRPGARPPLHHGRNRPGPPGAGGRGDGFRRALELALERGARENGLTGEPGLEPGLTHPECVVLPITPFPTAYWERFPRTDSPPSLGSQSPPCPSTPESSGYQPTSRLFDGTTGSPSSASMTLATRCESAAGVRLLETGVVPGC